MEEIGNETTFRFWLAGGIGIVLIVLGVWMFTNPGLALTTLVFAYGIAAIIMGIADILLYIQIHRFTGFGPITSMISGILSVMSGIMLLAYPKAGVLMLTLLFPNMVYRPLYFTPFQYGPYTFRCGKENIYIYADNKHYWTYFRFYDAFPPAVYADNNPLYSMRLSCPAGD